MIISIQPVQSWNNGQVTQLNTISAKINEDNLQNICEFYWQIGNATPTGTEVLYTWVQQGNLRMTPEEYEAWDNSNEAAITWVLDQLNLERAQVGMVADVPLLKTTSLFK